MSFARVGLHLLGFVKKIKHLPRVWYGIVFGEHKAHSLPILRNVRDYINAVWK